MSSRPRRSYTRRLLAFALPFAAIVSACGNSDDGGSDATAATTVTTEAAEPGTTAASAATTAAATTETTAATDTSAAPGTTVASNGTFAPVQGVPGVTDDEIHFAVLGTKSNNPLGTCILDCYATGIQAYFDWRNSQGGVNGRQMVIATKLDDELALNQQKALEIVAANDTFATFSAVQLATGWGDIANAGIPLYVWMIHPPAANGHENVFGTREPACIDCLQRQVPYAASLAGATKVASLGYGVSEASKKCAEATATSVEEYGPELGLELGYLGDELAFGLPNGIGPEVTAMREAGVDFIAGCLDLNGMKTLAQELERQGMLDATTLYHSNTYDQAFVEEAGELFEGDFVQAPFRPFEADPADSQMNEFLEWMGKGGYPINELAMDGWINADQAFQGILAAGPEFDRASVIAASNTWTEFTAGGLVQPIDFTRQHTIASNDDAGRAANGPKYDCIALVQVSGGAFEVVGDPAKPWNCWPGETSAWSEPTAMAFE
jgi:hypothetical protein